LKAGPFLVRKGPKELSGKGRSNAASSLFSFSAFLFAPLFLFSRKEKAARKQTNLNTPCPYR
jgi:hypothetical protein